MKIKKIDVVFIITGVIVVFVLAIAPKETTPKAPNDDIHRSLILAKDDSSCKNCHGVGTDKPLPPNHPKKDGCHFCHKLKK